MVQSMRRGGEQVRAGCPVLGCDQRQSKDNGVLREIVSVLTRNACPKWRLSPRQDDRKMCERLLCWSKFATLNTASAYITVVVNVR